MRREQLEGRQGRSAFGFPSPRNPGLPGFRKILRKSGKPDLRWGGVGGFLLEFNTSHPPPQPSPTRGEREAVRP